MTAEDSAQVDEQQHGLDPVDDQLIDRVACRARAGGLQLSGEGGPLQQLTKRLLESALKASSGRTVRHRLNRAGDRALNSALHTIAMTRMLCCKRTKAYTARRSAD